MPAERERPALFRRRQFVAPHRRRGWLLRLARPFLAAVVLVGAPAGAAVWALTSPVFALTEVTVHGAERVEEGWVHQALRPLYGRQLVRLRLSEIERRLGAHPWIAAVTARKELPHALSVELVERRPAALLRREGGIHYLDATGFVIGPYAPELGGAGLPLLSGLDDPPAQTAGVLAVVDEWRRVAPVWAGELSEVERLREGDYRVWADAISFPVRVGTSGLERGLDRLGVLLPRIVERMPESAEVDLRFSHQIVIKGAAVPRSQEG
ncbi:MAG: FtsQ-type POTRA domain-containing protein [Thermoanaerobaculia bacterium]|nr:FtsQ-type POTRA domain-containing protein [Thermoanaerobaculia bacterium]